MAEETSNFEPASNEEKHAALVSINRYRLSCIHRCFA